MKISTILQLYSRKHTAFYQFTMIIFINRDVQLQLHYSSCFSNYVNKLKLYGIEIRMFSIFRRCGNSDSIRNICIRGNFRVTPIPENLLENFLDGYVARRPADHLTRRVLDMSSLGRDRCRPQLIWMPVVDNDLKEAKLTHQTT